MAERIQMTLHVEGMTCDGCARHVTRGLQAVPAVEEVRVPGWQQGIAQVVAESRVSEEDLLSAVTAAGYRARVRERRQLGAERRFAEEPGADYDLVVVDRKSVV